ncbi:MAG: ABC transporter permease [Acidobacteriaceae bacterium]
MSAWSQFRGGLRGLFHSRGLDREVADEIRDYLEQATVALEETGISRDQARSTALASFGDLTGQRERIRSVGWENHLRPLSDDLRFALRQLRGCHLFVLTSILTIAIGISACVSIFIVTEPLFFSSSTYPNADRIVTVWEKASDGALIADTYGTFRGIATHTHSFAAIAAVKSRSAVTNVSGSTGVIEGQQVTPDYFAVYGAEPALGRVFHVSDRNIQGQHVAVISDALWLRGYKRDASVLGRQLNLDGSRYTIIGVMSQAFTDAMEPSSEFWTPLQYDDTLPSDGREWGHHLHIIGRLLPQVHINEAQHELAAVYANWAQTHVAGYLSSGGAPPGVSIESSHYLSLHAERPTFIAILAAATLFLALVCITVTGLLLVYGLQRRTGQPMRVARGAKGFRILRQLLLKGLALSIPAGVIGVYAARLGAGALESILSNGTPLFHVAHLDRNAIIFAAFFTLSISFLLGTLPFLLVRRSHFWQVKTACLTGMRNPLYRSLLIIEVAVSFALLGSAVLLLQSRRLLSEVKPGFKPAGVVALQIRMGEPTLDGKPIPDSFFAKTLDAVRGIPGVEAAGLVSQLPLSGEHQVYGIQFASQPDNVPDSAFHYSVTPGYFEAMQIRLLQGRLLNAQDMQVNADKVVLINASLAVRQFGDKNPIGQRIRVGLNAGKKDGSWATIIGVVDDVRQESLSQPGERAFYLPASQWLLPDRTFWLVLRAKRDDATIANRVRTTILNVDSATAISQVTTMYQLALASEKDQRVVLFLFEGFSGMSLLLLTIGIYALFTTRSERPFNETEYDDKREMTLSADVALRQTLSSTLLGLVAGALLMAGSESLLSRSLLQVAPFSPSIYTGVGISLGTFSLLIFVLQETDRFHRHRVPKRK